MRRRIFGNFSPRLRIAAIAVCALVAASAAAQTDTPPQVDSATAADSKFEVKFRNQPSRVAPRPCS